MVRRGEEVHETGLGKVRLQQASRRSVTVDADPEKLPEAFQRISVSADKSSIQDALESNSEELRKRAEQFAHLKEPSYYIRIY